MGRTAEFLDNFRAAVASHEPDRVAGCFREDYRAPGGDERRDTVIARVAAGAPRMAGSA
jgi:hypothetical protein